MRGWDDITAAIGLSLGGDRERGREQLERCWEQTTDTDHAQRCVLAHYLADLQPELADEVAWDERALAAHAHVAGDALAALGIPDARGLAPSLHLNLGDGYLRQGRPDDAGDQLRAGLDSCAALGDDGYAATVRRGLDRLGHRVRAAQDGTTGASAS